MDSQTKKLRRKTITQFHKTPFFEDDLSRYWPSNAIVYNMSENKLISFIVEGFQQKFTTAVRIELNFIFFL